MPPDRKDTDRSGAGSGVRGRTGEAYIEFKQVGQIMRVTAVDSDSGIEVVIMGPVAASQNDLKKVAVAKLKRRLQQEAAKEAAKDAE